MLFEASDQIVARLAARTGSEVTRIPIGLMPNGTLYRLHDEGLSVVLLEITDRATLLATIVTTDTARKFIKTKQRNVQVRSTISVNFPFEWPGGELTLVTKIVRLDKK